MKNQYCGDVGDYGKYGLLRYLAQKGIKIGVNWYLTKNDGSEDGNYISYLDKESERRYDPVVFDALKKIAGKENKSVQMIAAENLISNAIYFDELLDTETILFANERAEVRRIWHKNALNKLKEAELVFADPDNGSIGSKSLTDKSADKYVFPSEIKQYYQ